MSAYTSSASEVRNQLRDVSPSQEKSVRPTDSTLDTTVLGVCTGTGLGYLDYALVRFRQSSPSDLLRVELQQLDRIATPISLKDPIVSHLRDGRRGSHLASHLDELLGRLFAGGIHTFCRKHGLELTSIDFVSTHCEALRRLVARTSQNNVREHPGHWSSMVAAEIGITTVFDFTILGREILRPQTQPVSYFNRVLLRHPTKFRVCLNIEEIANLSFIPPYSNDSVRTTIAYDCGPGSLLIDYAMRYCISDRPLLHLNGDLATQGKVNQTVVDHFLHAHDYLRQLPPISIATEMFGDHEAQQLVDECLYSGMSDADTIATVTQVTAQNILKQYNRLLQLFFLPGQQVDEMFICGSTSHNSSIIDYLKSQLPESVITRPIHDVGIPGDAHQAVCYAYLAFEAVLEQTTRPDGTVDSSRPNTETVQAKFVPARGWSELVGHMREFSGGHPLHMATNLSIVGSLEAAVAGMGIR